MITGLGFVLFGIYLVVNNVKQRSVSKLKMGWINKTYKETPLKKRSSLKTAECEV